MDSSVDDCSKSSKKKRQGSHGNQDPKKARTAQAQKWSGSCEGGQAGSLVQLLQDLASEGVITLSSDLGGTAPHGVAGFQVLDLPTFRRRRTMWFQREGLETAGPDAGGSAEAFDPTISRALGHFGAATAAAAAAVPPAAGATCGVAVDATAAERDKESSVNQAFRSLNGRGSTQPTSQAGDHSWQTWNGLIPERKAGTRGYDWESGHTWTFDVDTYRKYGAPSKLRHQRAVPASGAGLTGGVGGSIGAGPAATAASSGDPASPDFGEVAAGRGSKPRGDISERAKPTGSSVPTLAAAHQPHSDLSAAADKLGVAGVGPTGSADVLWPMVLPAVSFLGAPGSEGIGPVGALAASGRRPSWPMAMSPPIMGPSASAAALLRPGLLSLFQPTAPTNQSVSSIATALALQEAVGDLWSHRLAGGIGQALDGGSTWSPDISTTAGGMGGWVPTPPQNGAGWWPPGMGGGLSLGAVSLGGAGWGQSIPWPRSGDPSSWPVAPARHDEFGAELLRRTTEWTSSGAVGSSRLPFQEPRDTGLAHQFAQSPGFNAPIALGQEISASHLLRPTPLRPSPPTQSQLSPYFVPLAPTGEGQLQGVDYLVSDGQSRTNQGELEKVVEIAHNGGQLGDSFGDDRSEQFPNNSTIGREVICDSGEQQGSSIDGGIGVDNLLNP